MEPILVVALISGLVALLVAYGTTAFKFSHDKNILEDQLNQRHLEKVYGLRLERYPGAFEITESIQKRAKSKGGIIPRGDLVKKKEMLLERKCGSVSLILSRNSIEAFNDLISVLDKECENKRDI